VQTEGLTKRMARGATINRVVCFSYRYFDFKSAWLNGEPGRLQNMIWNIQPPGVIVKIEG